MKYLKQFIIGSSFPVVVLFYNSVYQNIEKKKVNDPEYFKSLSEKEIPFFWKEIWPKKYNYYSYFRYTITAPIYFGMWNVISLIIANYFGLTMRIQYIVIGIISSLFMMIFHYIYNIYDFKTNVDFSQYYIRLFIKYMLIWNIIIYNIEKHI